MNPGRLDWIKIADTLEDGNQCHFSHITYSGTVSIMWLVITQNFICSIKMYANGAQDLFRRLKRFIALVMVLHLSEFHSSISDLINRPKHFRFTIFTKHVLLTAML